jgi:hypothetical protein
MQRQHLADAFRPGSVKHPIASQNMPALHAPPPELGSGLIDHSQKMTVAAIAMADMKVWAQRS